MREDAADAAQAEAARKDAEAALKAARAEAQAVLVKYERALSLLWGESSKELGSEAMDGEGCSAGAGSGQSQGPQLEQGSTAKQVGTRPEVPAGMRAAVALLLERESEAYRQAAVAGGVLQD